MKNAITKYDTIETDDYIVTDYTSKKLYQIYDLPEINDPLWVDWYQLADNETIEMVSYNVYNSAQYWDVILFVNQADPLFDMVYDFDFTAIAANAFIDNYNMNIYVSPSLPLDYLTALKDKKVEEFESDKELKRVIKIIRPNKLMDFMKLIREKEII